MKISQLSSHYRPVLGGQEVYIRNLNRVLLESGHETVVYQLSRGESAEDNVCFPKVPFLAKFIPEFETRWLRKMIAWTQPKGLLGADVLISHYAALARPLSSVAKKTIVLSHGVEWKTESQRAVDIDREENAKWCLERYPHVVNDTYYLRYLGIDATPGEGYFTEVSPGKWFIPNCVDTDHFTEGEGLVEFKDRKIILVPRQMVADRGIDLAIDAFAKLAKENTDVEMCLLGKRWSGGSAYIEKLARMICEYKLEDRIFFRDPVPNDDMPSWYRSSVVTLIPTLRREGTSLSAIESMSCGVATVSTNVVGLADLPTMQCEAEAEAMAQALKEALADPEVLGSAQQAIVRKQLNLENWARGWEQVISQVGNS